MKGCKSYRKALCAVLKCGPRQRFGEPLADPWLTDLGDTQLMWHWNFSNCSGLHELWLGLKGDKKWEKMCSRTVDCTFIHLAAYYAPQCLGSCTRIAAQTISKGLFSSVYAFMCFQITNFTCRIVTYITFERFFSSMHPSVFYKSTCLCTGIATLRATERLLCSMHPSVSL